MGKGVQGQSSYQVDKLKKGGGAAWASAKKTINPDYWVEGYEEYIASISYGKDSLAMLEVLFAFGYPLTQVVTVDVMATATMSAYHGEVEQFREYADKVILERYGIEVTHLKSKRTYDETFHRIRQGGKRTKPENVGKIYGFPMTMGAWCNRDLKMNPINAYKEKNQFWYIGYAIDEKKPERQQKIKNCQDLRMYPLCNHNLRERVHEDMQESGPAFTNIHHIIKGWLLVLPQPKFGTVAVT